MGKRKSTPELPADDEHLNDGSITKAKTAVMESSPLKRAKLEPTDVPSKVKTDTTKKMLAE